MKIKEGFIKRQVGDCAVVAPIGERAIEFQGMINLNETASAVWDVLLEGTDEEKVLQFMTETYEIEYEQAKEKLALFLNKLEEAGVLER